MANRLAAAFTLGEKVVERVRPDGDPQVMSVAGHRVGPGRVMESLCTWTEADKQSYHQWFPDASLERYREKEKAGGA